MKYEKFHRNDFKLSECPLCGSDITQDGETKASAFNALLSHITGMLVEIEDWGYLIEYGNISLSVLAKVGLDAEKQGITPAMALIQLLQKEGAVKPVNPPKKGGAICN